MFWTKVAHFILKFRVAILIVVVLITAFMAYQVQFLKMDYGYAGMLPDTDPVSINLEKFRKQFGEDATILMFATYDKDFFKVDKFNDWNALRDALKKIEGVDQVLSVSDVYNIKKNRELKVFEYQKLFPDRITSQAELDSLVGVLHNLPIYEDLVYADSARVIIMMGTFDPDYLNSKAREKIVADFEKLVATFGDKYGLDFHFSGLPYVRTRLMIMIKSELLKFIFLAAGILAIVLYLFFRSFRAVAFSLLITSMGVAWALALIVLLDFRITILTGMLPAVLIVIGIPNCVFLLNKYHQEYRKHANKIKALQRVIQKVGNAIFLTNLTTAAGFATFIIIQHRILSRFGLVSSFGIMALFILSITLVPIIFSYLPPPTSKETKHLENKLVARIVSGFVRIILNRRPVIYSVVVVMMGLSAWGITKMTSTGFIVDDIPFDDPVYVDLKFFEEHIKGVMPLEIAIDTRKPNGVLQTKTLQRAEDLQNKLAEYPDLSRSLSIIDGLKFARQSYFNGDVKYYRLPSNQEKNFILSYLKEQDSNNYLLNMLVDTSYQTMRINLRVADIGTYRMLELQDSVQKQLDQFFPPDEYDTMLTGSSLTFSLGTKYLVRNLLVSLGLAIILISIFMAWMFKSFRMVLISISPNILPLIFTAGLMGFFNIPIKPSTVLVFSVAFGISVDTAIHFLAKFRQELACKGAVTSVAVINAIREVGVSILYTVLILFLGFGVFVASKFGGTVAMGLLVSITLFVAVFSNLLLVPSILLSLDKRKKAKSH